MFQNHSCHWLQPVVDDEFGSVALVGDGHLTSAWWEFRPQLVHRLKSVSTKTKPAEAG